ncbi:hypothetical protein [Schlesneria paludicola]|uniref:hypothetical protein n=1 Tax=Schlesneria paludicola TaxID=360056 RepID=UPI0002F8135A|nr:hypothetical protein [Schlesneria paludicola]
MKVHVQTAYDPSRWIMRKATGYKVIVNDEIIYTSGTGFNPGSSQLDLYGDSTLILKRTKKDDSKNWLMFRNGIEIARIAHRYGITLSNFYDVMARGVTYKSFGGLSSLSKDKSFYKGIGRWGNKFWFIDEIGFEVAAMIALYETCVIWES